MKRRVMVAMSGGVDSSVAAALLQRLGYEVIGLTMCFNLKDNLKGRPVCCGLEGIEDARAVARKLKIRHYVLNMRKSLEGKIIKDFCLEYLRGRTPNPCVRCNQYLKFGELLKKSLALGADFVSTGHYARVCKNKGIFELKKAKDLHKDQSYFLYRINQEQLKHILFPLGNLLKTEVRSVARELGLRVSEKPGSQEVCFLSGANYRSFLRRNLKTRIRPGLIIDTQGNILGGHAGVPFYTIGQREGLGIAVGYPLYIIDINARNNQIIVGRKEEAFGCEFIIEDLHYVSRPIKKEFAAMVRIRYNHREAAALISPLKNEARVRFLKPQFAITPGQSAVFYAKDTVIGGGVIKKVLN